jgi:hypothetical protein
MMSGMFGINVCLVKWSFVLSGLTIHLTRENPGLCPGLMNRGPSGLNDWRYPGLVNGGSSGLADRLCKQETR